MWMTDDFIKVTMTAREREAERDRLVSEARRQVRQDGTARGWLWRVEPGMEGAFRNLLGWLLSGQRGAPAELASSAQEHEGSAPLGQTAPTARDEGSIWCCCPSAYCPPGCCAQAG